MSEAQLFYWRTAYCKVVNNNTEHSWYNGNGDGDEFYEMGWDGVAVNGDGVKADGDGVGMRIFLLGWDGDGADVHPSVTR